MSQQIKVARAKYLERLENCPGEKTVGEKIALARECAEMCGLSPKPSSEDGPDPIITAIMQTTEGA